MMRTLMRREWGLLLAVWIGVRAGIFQQADSPILAVSGWRKCLNAHGRLDCGCRAVGRRRISSGRRLVAVTALAGTHGAIALG